MPNQPYSITGLHDSCLRFVFEHADVRGQIVYLDKTYADVTAIQHYPPGVQRLLGEFLAATALLSTTLKFAGKLILQVRGNGQIPLLMVECSHELSLRAIVRGADRAYGSGFADLLGEGSLAITVDPRRGERHQGIVPLEGSSLEQCLDTYFTLSEQLPSRFWLVSNGRQAAGMLLQQLPPGVMKDHGQRDIFWEHICTLAATVTAEEMLTLPPVRLLGRLFPEDPLRLFEPQPVRFRCTCSRQRTTGALTALGSAEVQALLTEQGEVTMDCEFCGHRYHYGYDELQQILTRTRRDTIH